MNDAKVELQRAYYRSTAQAYDEMHSSAESEHESALQYLAALAPLWGINSILDIGSGTGRAVVYLRNAGFDVRGVEPVRELIDKALEKDAALAGLIVQGDGEALPFPDRSFDAVCEFGVLHHVARPELVVAEMTRVARRAVVLSDANRFGQGSRFARLCKLALYKVHLWPLVDRIKTRGKGYTITAGDGLAYSYSVYDSFDQLATWADNAVCIPTRPTVPKLWNHPLLTAETVLFCALRQT